MTSIANILRPGRRRWRDFWSMQTTPLHAAESKQDYQALAAELRLLFADRTIDRVLEIGCGNGALFTGLGFHAVTRYVGTDFSPAMLAEFGARYPGVELVRADGPNFRSAEKFDLVFSSHVIQYWDRGQLARHLDHAKSMIAAGGLVVLAGIPWSRMRLAHGRGDLIGGDRIGGERRSLPMAALNAARELIRPEIGHWYDFPEFEELAATRDFRVAFRGSGYYPARFHAVLQPRT